MAITTEQKKALEAAGYSVKGNTVMTKNGGSVGGYNENGKIWSGSQKVRDILKSKPVEKAQDRPAKAASKPAAKKPTPRPKANPARKPGGARPEGSASGMPAAKKTEGGKAAAAAIPVIAAGARVTGVRKPAQATPSNPNYTGRAAMPEGPQGRYATGVGRPAAGGGRAIGGNPARRIRGGGGGVLKMPDILDYKNMAKGGLVSKKKK